jgi:hypothetical protein
MKSTNAGQLLGIAIAIAGFLLISAGFVTLGYQCVLWLQHGYWIPLAMREAKSIFDGSAPFNDPTFIWLGVQKIVAWILDVPLSAGLIVLGFCSVVTGFLRANAANDRWRVARNN